MPWTPRHKQRRGRQGIWEANLALGENGTAPVYSPLTIKPQAAPSGTAQEGDIYWDSTIHAPAFHNGTGFIYAGGIRPVKTAAATLTAADSGALCLFNAAAGFLYTLPTAAKGLSFDFLVTTTVTSASAKILTASASEFLLGGFTQIPDTAAQTVVFAANGTTIRSWNGNGSTTGGFIGDTIHVVGLSATQWAVYGYGLATGTEATPFATS